jgi:hypothetical protein
MSSSQPHSIGPTVCPTSQPSKYLGSCRKGYCQNPPFKLFNRVQVHIYLLDTDTTLLYAMVSGRCQPCYNHKSVMLYIETPSQTCTNKLVGQPCKHSGDTMSHGIHSTLGVSYHDTLGVQSNIHLEVLLGSYQVLGTA